MVSGVYAEKAPGPCEDDVANFCKDVKPGGGSIIKCLKEHENELSAVCKTHLQEAKQKREEKAKICESDVAKFCKDVKPGGGRIAKCLKEHEAELSGECKAQMPQMKK
jgi:hypothetical protein